MNKERIIDAIAYAVISLIIAGLILGAIGVFMIANEKVLGWF